jgi:hypothetical protein
MAAHAQEEVGNASGAFSLLRIESSARAGALAGTSDALVAVTPGLMPDPAAALGNPALLTPEAHRSLAVSYLDHRVDVRSGSAAYAREVPGVGTLGAAVRYLSYGEFERAGPDGLPDGSFGGGETAITIMAARPIAGLPSGIEVRGGAALTAAFATLDDRSASLYVADLAVTTHLPGPAATASVVLRGLPLASDALGPDEPAPPADLRISVAKRLRYLPFTFAVTGRDLLEIGDGSAMRHVNAAGEIRLGRPVAIRAGYDFRRSDDLSSDRRLDLAGLSMGFGINLSRLAFDYAYHGWGAFGGMHQFAVRTKVW